MFQSMGCTLQARPQEPPEVYSNVLPLSVGDTTGGIHPMPSGINIFAPPEVNIPKAPQVNTAPRGRKTVGKQPKAPQVNISAPPEVNVPYSWAELCRHIRRSHRRYTQTHTRRGGDSTAGIHPSTAGKHLHEHL